MTSPSAPSKELRDIFLMRSHPSYLSVVVGFCVAADVTAQTEKPAGSC